MQNVSMAGRVCLVTGATSGIGKATAEVLAQTGATLILHGRDERKIRQLCADLKTGTNHDNIHFLLADFASLSEVRALAVQLRAQFGILHVLINNAGVLTDQRQVSHDGYEWTFAVNHLAPFLLTSLVLDLLQANMPARIAFNSSSAMGAAQLDFSDLQMERHFDGWTAYANTKLANMLCANLFAEKLAGTGVVSNSFCPGLIDTNLLVDNQDFGEAQYARLKLMMRSVREGAITPVFLATEPQAATINGKFFLKSHGNGMTPVPISWDREVAARLWNVSRECVTRWLD
ncbi:MAG: SDR family NAD(P)-dependent oxidoreductase [Gammaproteobacteria bacterium]|jgi:NAD(P)-dependent dehydrogenase (short-subunit alcohol dehydrogenase family)|nr:short-chain dehydrogenase [Chromatiales bacterium]MCP4927164.1 SDR family NAD(P)-dependent oxidoreductase [Gammaproteobacteria bacterium]MDP7153141.1 SDR family NAD(P)-dependent oxidoreductase [Gammaproteobacteria bacterium]MDP7296063.1 SDR family NAD(P)-dependent oxidoreductase [Gammaproteobacteria bacterium]MDP7419101.1 SDR family NAD(P)-dependent oxidoreductase [Gammaproteobacteria bacterium]